MKTAMKSWCLILSLMIIAVICSCGSFDDGFKYGIKFHVENEGLGERKKDSQMKEENVRFLLDYNAINCEIPKETRKDLERHTFSNAKIAPAGSALANSIEITLSGLKGRCFTNLQVSGDDKYFVKFCYQMFLEKEDLLSSTKKKKVTKKEAKNEVDDSEVESSTLEFGSKSILGHYSEENSWDQMMKLIESMNLFFGSSVPDFGMLTDGLDSKPRDWEIITDEGDSVVIPGRQSDLYFQQRYGNSIIQFHCSEVRYLSKVFEIRSGHWIAFFEAPEVCNHYLYKQYSSAITVDCHFEDIPLSQEPHGVWSIVKSSNAFSEYFGTVTFSHLNYLSEELHAFGESSLAPTTNFYHLRWDLSATASYDGWGLLADSNLCSIWFPTPSRNGGVAQYVASDDFATLEGTWFFDEYMGTEKLVSVKEVECEREVITKQVMPDKEMCGLSEIIGLYRFSGSIATDNANEFDGPHRLSKSYSGDVWIVNGGAPNLFSITWTFYFDLFRVKTFRGTAILRGNNLCTVWSDDRVNDFGIVSYKFSQNKALGLWTILSPFRVHATVQKEDLLRKL